MLEKCTCINFKFIILKEIVKNDREYIRILLKNGDSDIINILESHKKKNCIK